MWRATPVINHRLGKCPIAKERGYRFNSRSDTNVYIIKSIYLFQTFTIRRSVFRKFERRILRLDLIDSGLNYRNTQAATKLKH